MNEMAGTTRDKIDQPADWQGVRFSLAALHGQPHRVEHRIDRHFGFHLGDVGDLRDLVDNVDLDHAWAPRPENSVTTIEIVT